MACRQGLLRVGRSGGEVEGGWRCWTGRGGLVEGGLYARVDAPWSPGVGRAVVEACHGSFASSGSSLEVGSMCEGGRSSEFVRRFVRVPEVA